MARRNLWRSPAKLPAHGRHNCQVRPRFLEHCPDEVWTSPRWSLSGNPYPTLTRNRTFFISHESFIACSQCPLPPFPPKNSLGLCYLQGPCRGWKAAAGSLLKLKKPSSIFSSVPAAQLLPASPLCREHTCMKNLCQQPQGRSQHFIHLIGRNRRTKDSHNTSFPSFIFSDSIQDNLRGNEVLPTNIKRNLLAREECKGNDLQMKPKWTAHSSGWWLMEVKWWLLQRKGARGRFHLQCSFLF